MRLLALFVLFALVASFPCFATTQRDPAQRAAFVKEHPCPSSGKTKRRCPGYVVDHIVPLCAGGRDHPSNMQWQTVAEAKQKDRIEEQECRRMRGRR